mmetsp:Transcript_41614/g.53676  ORF Transcript_41614/g.53676 Transcript_41614/m.53676 type:complete len:123 (+) Transcript_41614:1171-1539(+)
MWVVKFHHGDMRWGFALVGAPLIPFLIFLIQGYVKNFIIEIQHQGKRQWWWWWCFKIKKHQHCSQKIAPDIIVEGTPPTTLFSIHINNNNDDDDKVNDDESNITPTSIMTYDRNLFLDEGRF